MRGFIKAALLMPALLLLLQAAPSEAERLTMPLSKLHSENKIDLKCIEAEAGVSVPIPERFQVHGARLKLRYVNSNSLLPNLSQFYVKVNGFSINQQLLSPLVPENTIEIEIPVGLLEPGYNRVSFHVSQHYQDQCETFCAPNLWTTLWLEDSHIEMDYDLKPVPLELSKLPDFLFDPKTIPVGKVNIVTKDRKAETLTHAAVVASGVARRFDYKEVRFTLSQTLREGMDNIVLGDATFLNTTLASHGAASVEVKGPLLRVMQMPLPARNGIGPDNTHALLAISGKDMDQIKLAAETFANMTFPYPGTAELVATGFELPEISMYGGRLVLRSDKTYTFKSLNFPSTTFYGLNPPTKSIVFRLPADFMIEHNKTAKLSLSFAYGAGMKTQSALNIGVNGNFVRAIHLGNTNGEFIENYRVDLPTYLFKPGANKLEFSPVLEVDAKECELVQTGNLFLSVFDVSSLYFPPMPHFVQLPNLQLFMFNGFPLTRWPDGYEATIYTASTDDATVSAALNMVGMITQKNGYPLFGISMATEPPLGYTGELLVVGPLKSIPEEYLASSPLSLGKESTVPYPVVTGWDDEISYATSKQISGLGPGQSALMQFQSPVQKGRSVVLVTAVESADLLKLSEALLDPGVQANCKGDIAFIRLTPPKYGVATADVGKRYFAGKLGTISALQMYLHANPYFYYLIVALAVLCFGALIYFVLLRRKKKLEKHAGNIKDTV